MRTKINFNFCRRLGLLHHAPPCSSELLPAATNTSIIYPQNPVLSSNPISSHHTPTLLHLIMFEKTRTSDDSFRSLGCCCLVVGFIIISRSNTCEGRGERRRRRRRAFGRIATRRGECDVDAGGDLLCAVLCMTDGLVHRLCP